MVDNSKYPIEVFWSVEDGEYIAIAPDLKGCSASGLTRKKALEGLEIAMNLWLEVAEGSSAELPTPGDQI